MSEFKENEEIRVIMDDYANSRLPMGLVRACRDAGVKEFEALVLIVDYSDTDLSYHVRVTDPLVDFGGYLWIPRITAAKKDKHFQIV